MGPDLLVGTPCSSGACSSAGGKRGPILPYFDALRPAVGKKLEVAVEERRKEMVIARDAIENHQANLNRMVVDFMRRYPTFYYKLIERRLK